MGDSKNILEKDDASYHNEHGHEVNSPFPAYEIAILSNDQQSADYELSRIKNLVKREISAVAGKNNMETWDEANDFEIEDEFDDTQFEDTKYMKEEYINVAPQAIERQDDPPPSTKRGGEDQPVPAGDSDQKEEA